MNFCLTCIDELVSLQRHEFGEEASSVDAVQRVSSRHPPHSRPRMTGSHSSLPIRVNVSGEDSRPMTSAA